MKCDVIVTDNTTFLQMMDELLSVQFFTVLGGCLVAVVMVQYILSAMNITKFWHHAAVYGVLFAIFLAASLYSLS